MDDELNENPEVEPEETEEPAAAPEPLKVDTSELNKQIQTLLEGMKNQQPQQQFVPVPVPTQQQQGPGYKDFQEFMDENPTAATAFLVQQHMMPVIGELQRMKQQAVEQGKRLNKEIVNANPKVKQLLDTNKDEVNKFLQGVTDENIRNALGADVEALAYVLGRKLLRGEDVKIDAPHSESPTPPEPPKPKEKPLTAEEKAFAESMGMSDKEYRLWSDPDYEGEK
jgi:hypothetical protein